MENCTKWELHSQGIYHKIFEIIVRNPRMHIDEIAKEMNYTGRGKSRTTISRHYKNMKIKKITKDPILFLKAFRETQSHVYFCREERRTEVRRTYKKLKASKDFNYVLSLAGDADFMIISRFNGNLSDLDILSKSILYTPIFTIPLGWNKSDTLKDMTNFNYEKGKIDRKIDMGVSWTDLEWQIYRAIRGNVRVPYLKIGKKLNVDHKTVKAHCENIFKNCEFGFYFFPRGYDYYRQTFLRIETQYERSFIDALSLLSTTAYVYPLEKEIAVNVFHENINNFIECIQNLEETGIIDSYLMSIPAASTDNF